MNMESATSKSYTNYKDTIKQRSTCVSKSPSAPTQKVVANTCNEPVAHERQRRRSVMNNKEKGQLVASKIEEISQRPVKCLFQNCKKYVAIPDIKSHFWYNHDDVAMIAGDGENFHIWVNPDTISIDSSTCIALILLIDNQNFREDKLCKKNITPTQLSKSLPAFVMASRMHVGTKEPAVLFWVSEAEPQLHCSIHVTQFSSPNVSVGYSGPTNNLRLDKDFQGVLERSFCALVLPNIVQTLVQHTRGFDVTIRLKTV